MNKMRTPYFIRLIGLIIILLGVVIFPVNQAETVSAQATPRIVASPTKYWISAYDWPTGETLTLTINGVFAGTDVVEVHSWSSGQILANFNPPVLNVGDVLTISNPEGSITKTLTLAPIQITGVQQASSTVSGTASPNTAMIVGINDPTTAIIRHVQSNTQGAWTTTFATPGPDPNDEGTNPFDSYTNGWAFINDEDGDQTSINWRQPHINILLDSHSVAAYDWPLGEELTLTVSNPVGAPYTATVVNGGVTHETEMGFYQFFLPQGFPLNPGQQVTVTDGTHSRTTTVADLQPPVVNVPNSQISGTATAGAQLWINMCNSEGCANRTVNANASGTYLFDFSAAGPNTGEESTIHLHPGDQFTINWSDGSGNNTARGWSISKPYIFASGNKHWINAEDWPAGETLTLTINGVFAGTDLVEVHSWSNGRIVASFGPPVLNAGDVLTISNPGGSITKTLTLAAIQITDVQFATSTISGTAAPNTAIYVGVNNPTTAIVRNVQSNAQGAWTTTFATPGPDPRDAGTASFNPDTNGWANIEDEDSDETTINWRLPHINVFLDSHSAAAYDWPAGKELTLTVSNPAGAPYTAAVMNGGVTSDTEMGFYQFFLPQDFPLNPGQQVTVSGSAMTRTTMIKNLLPPVVDMINSRVSGTAEPGATIKTCLKDVWPCIPRSVTANASGNYVIDFRVPGSNPGEERTYQLGPGSGGTLHWRDELGNNTSRAWNVPYNITLEPAQISENMPAGSPVGALSTNDPDGGQTYTYSLVSGTGSADNAAFSITGSMLYLKGVPDYETRSTYSIRVRAAHNGAPAQFLEQAFTITVTNQVEPPVVTSFSKSGTQGSPITFAASDYADHFVSLESTGTGILEKIKITGLPAHGALRVGSGANLTLNSEVLTASLGQMVYTPAANEPMNDTFQWTGADSTGYAVSSAQVSLTLGFVARYGLQVSPAGDAKSAVPGTNAVYTLILTNVGNAADGYTITPQGTPAWVTSINPSQISSLAAGAQTAITVSVAVPIHVSGSNEVVLNITSQADNNQAVSVKLTTTAVDSPVKPNPVLLRVIPGSANISDLSTTKLTLTGANFSSPMTVTVGNLASASVLLNSSVELVATAPTGLLPGTYLVQACATGNRCASLSEAFTVVDNRPVATGVHPAHGHNDSENNVAVHGYNLSASTTFTLVGLNPSQQPAGARVTGSVTHITIPAGIPAGTYDLQVCNQTLCSILPGAYTSLTMKKNDFAAAAGDLWIAPVTIREGNNVVLGLNVHRVSGLGLSSAQVAFYRDDPNVPANKIGPSTNPETSMMAAGSAESVTIAWAPVGVIGAVNIYAVIDPNHLLTEVTRSNNVVSTTIQILPREDKDEAAPIIHALTIHNGAAITGERQVGLALQAVDNPGGSGIATMNIVEREYNTSARQWIAVQETGWIPYQPNTQWNLSDQGGIHYIQAWVADQAGNASELAQAQINYQPAQETITAGQVRIYRLEQSANTQKSFVLQTISGDADLYVWDPQGNLVAASITTGTINQVDFTTGASGVYQIEVTAEVDSTYSINFQAAAPGAGQTAEVLALFNVLEKVQRWQPTIPTQNEPLNMKPSFPAPITAWRDSWSVFLPLIIK